METILEVKNLKKLFYKNKIPLIAVDQVSFHVDKGESVAIVGESGSGKSTIAKIITQLIHPDAGEVFIDGIESIHAKGKLRKELYTKVQMVFQMPQESFDPRRSFGDGIMESMRNHGMTKKEAKARMIELLQMVELPSEYAKRYPHQVSGGQCQRAAIARALAISPKLIVCDEATSALDVTVQAQIITLLKKLKQEMGLSLLVISHDLNVVQNLCDRVLVMYQGRIIEEGTPDHIIQNPKEEYTKRFMESNFMFC